MSADQELLDAIRSGSDKAFATLYQRHAESALRYAHRVCRTGDAEDIVSEIWMRVLNGPPEDGARFRAWMRVCIRREAWRRAAARDRVGTLRESGHHGGTSPTRNVARREALGLLEHARERGDLSTIEFAALVLDLEGWQASQCAEAAGVTRTTWSDRLQRARKKLRRFALGGAAAARPRP